MSTALTALADPTRRSIFELVAEKPRSVSDLARALPISQPAVSQHLKVLKEARLVRSEPSGAKNVYHVDPTGLGPMRAWLDQFWEAALNNFKQEVAKSKKEKEEKP
jgi:DNA-binding transcriptional ArsR family regulator